MEKKQNRVKSSQAVVSKNSTIKYISGRYIKEFYKLNGKRIEFAIAEISDGEDGYTILPVILIPDLKSYICLQTGHIVPLEILQQRKCSIYSASSRYDRDAQAFKFKAPQGSHAFIKESTLIQIFGCGVINERLSV